MSYSVKIQILLSETVNVTDIDWEKGNIVKVFLNPLLCRGALDLHDVRRVLRGKGLKIKLNSCLLTIILSRNFTKCCLLFSQKINVHEQIYLLI